MHLRDNKYVEGKMLLFLSKNLILLLQMSEELCFEFWRCPKYTSLMI